MLGTLISPPNTQEGSEKHLHFLHPWYCNNSISRSNCIGGLGLAAIPGVEVDQVSSSDESDDGKSSDREGDTLKLYQKTVPTGSADDGVDEITKGVNDLTTDDKTNDESKDNLKDKTKDKSSKDKSSRDKSKDKGGK